MSKISKRLLKTHDEAEALIKKDILSFDERYFVLENYLESIHSDQNRSASFFTPKQMARSFVYNTFGYINTDRKITVIDLCAGIGSLSRSLIDYFGSDANFEINCVEINPNFVEVGKKVVPEATWYCGDVLDLDFILSLGQFDYAISNPPFGNVPTVSKKPSFNYTGAEGEYKILDVASVIANHVGFIVPQDSSGFKYSGVRSFSKNLTTKFNKFIEQTNIEIGFGIPLDTSDRMGSFRNTNMIIEFIEADTSDIKADLINHELSQQSIF